MDTNLREGVSSRKRGDYSGFFETLQSNYDFLGNRDEAHERKWHGSMTLRLQGKTSKGDNC